MKDAYTIQIQDDTVILKCHTGADDITIQADHKKFDWIMQNEGRVINISDSGRWSSSKDYKGYYSGHSVAQVAKQDIKPVITRLGDLNLSDDLFVPMKTGTIADKIMSTEGGFMPATNIMAAGAPGIGKTTLLLELMYSVMVEDPSRRCLFISAEMNQMDMARYLKRFPHWARIPILFLGDQEGNPQACLESILQEGWDLVLTDSYTEVNDEVKEECNLTRSKTEKWFLSMMDKHNKGGNDRGIYTTFITILQLSKGGNFVGSNKLKHLTTSMMHLDWRGGENSTERYIEFSKNRVGQVGRRLYFSLDDGLTFESERFQRDLLNHQMLEEERKGLQAEQLKFDELFGRLDTPGTEEEIESTEQAG